jgi:hypothetical protein
MRPAASSVFEGRKIHDDIAPSFHGIACDAVWAASGRLKEKTAKPIAAAHSRTTHFDKGQHGSG